MFHLCSHGSRDARRGAKFGLEGAYALRPRLSGRDAIHPECVYRKQLDLETLVATRGPNFPLSRLESRLMCPSCGNRQVTVVFEPPSNALAVKRGI
jgi:hypothetical protein